MPQHSNYPRNNNLVFSAAFAAVLLLTAILSWPALSGPFLFDDFPNLENLALLNGHLDWASLANYASLYRSEPGRPLSMLSFVINDFDWPSDPLSFKYTNLMLHLLIGVLIFGFSRTLARLRTNDATRVDLVALLTASAWLLHPMQLSTTMLVVQRMTQLSAAFGFAGLWGYLALATRANHPLSAICAIAALGAGTVLAVLCKETGALIPLLAVVINYTLLAEKIARLPIAQRRILQLGTILPVAMLLILVTLKLDIPSGYANRPFTLSDRVLSETRALCEYLFNIIVPSLRGGGIYHDDFLVSRGFIKPWTTLPSVLVVTGSIIGALVTTRRFPVFSFAVLWFFAGHLLESTIIPLELYFEHRNYLPMFGVLFGLAFTAVNIGKMRLRKWILSVAFAWIAFSALLTAIEAPIWGNERALTAVWAIEHPDSPRAIQQRAASYYKNGEAQKAAQILLDAYSRGIRGSDYPAQVLLLACARKDEGLANQAQRFLPESLRYQEYSRALTTTFRKLRKQVQRDHCPQQVTSAMWLALTTRLLENPSYANGEAAAYLHTERAYFYMAERNLNATMSELENAWKANKTPELAQLISATLASAGLNNEARVWAERALENRTRGVRGWFSNDEVKSKAMLKSIGQAERASE